MWVAGVLNGDHAICVTTSHLPGLHLCAVSYGETQRFTIGARVDGADGRCGHLTRVIIDPVAQSLTHLVVTFRHREKRSRLVPVASWRRSTTT
jgi:hypothetical protein